jgi:glucosamine kinase
MEAAVDFYLGIDAGGSHCRARVTDSEGRVIGAATAGPANTRIGIDALHERLLAVSSEALHSGGVPETSWGRVAAGFGVAGISRPGMADALTERGFPFASLALDSDAAIANFGAHGGADGAILILGTGSVGFVQVDGKRLTVGGYGFPISDEGSGAALGLSAVRHALRALDGRTKPTPLSHAVTERFDHQAASVVSWMDQATPGDYGELAPLVMDYAEANDEIALSIVEDAVLHVERFITTIFAKGAPRLALVGGLSARLRPWLRVRTASRLSEPLGDALQGALFLAGYRERLEVS